MRPLASIVILLLLSACGEAGDRSATKETAPAADTPAKPEPAKPDAAKPDAAKPDTKAGNKPKAKKDMSAKQAGDLRKQFLRKLNEGRELTKAKKYEEGIKLYHEALAIEPTNPAALAELGWAALQSNQLDLAQGATSQALTFSRKPEQQGMILYNLGRVAEARGLIDEAVGHYHESLARRPNATVQKQLDGLLASATTKPGESQGLGRIASGIPDLEAVCKTLAEKECANIYTIEEDGCACDPNLGDEEKGWVLIELGENDAVENALWFPAIKTSAGWVVFDAIGWVYNPGVFGIWEEARWDSLDTKDLLPGGDPEWVLEFSKNRFDSDMGLNEFETDDYAMTVVCAREGASAWCTQPMLREASYNRDVEFPDQEVPEGEDPITHEGLPISKKFACKLELGAKVIVSDIVGAGDGDEACIAGIDALPAGEHDLATLLGKTLAPK